MAKLLGLKDTIDRHRKPDDNLYAIIDAARDEDLYMISRYIMKLEFQTLFVGELAPVTLHVAPLLVQIPEETEFFDLWAGRFGNSSGILMLSPSSPDELLVHLRKIFHVKSDDGTKYLFRYYDPRVFRPFLKTFEPDQVKDFFGPITWFFVEDEEFHKLLACNQGLDSVFQSETVALAPFDPKSKYAPPPKEENEEKKTLMSRFKKS